MTVAPSALVVESLRAVPVDVPMRRPLGTSAETITSAPLLLVDLVTGDGIVGRAYVFCYLRQAALLGALVLEEAARVIAGKRAAPLELGTELARRFRLIGSRGPIAMALAAVDVACWDALAIAAGLPLAELLGGSARPIAAYNSNGLGLMSVDAVADEAEALLDGGFRAVKIRLGRADPKADLAAVRAVRKRVPAEISLMADFNQALSLADARGRCAALDDEGLAWIEEPIRHDDYAGAAMLAAELRTPIQLGENFVGPRAMAEALGERACDHVMPDLDRIGGVSGWQQAAALASIAGIEMSSHLFPEVSAHLLAATPTRHWLEYVDWAAPLLEEPLEIRDGNAIVPARPGNGLVWDEAAVDRYRFR